MPKMGDAMEEGTLLKWLKNEGEEVSEGDPIAEIETDKVTMELEAEDEGTLAQLIADEGQEVPVGDAIAFIQGEGEEVPERSEGGGEEEAEEGGEEDGGGAQATATETEAPEEAEMRGFQPARLPEPTEEPGTSLVEPTRMMQVIGERMTEAKQHIPHFYATVEVRMDAAMALRKQLNAQLEDEGIKLSVNDFVMKACAVALRIYPNLNALYTTRGVELHEKVDMAMAVALDQGLITPVIRDIGSKGLAAISQESKDLASRAREGKLQPDEYQGGTITVSNMGMFGVESFTAIINPPQAAIVAVSSIIKRPTYDENDELVPTQTMKLTLSADHRITNGADGAQYMAAVKRLLENPMMLLV